MKDIEDPINYFKGKFQNTQIIISSLFPRNERNLWGKIIQINNFLKRAQQAFNI